MKGFLIHLQEGSQFGLTHPKGCAYCADPAGARMWKLDGFEGSGLLVEKNLIFDVAGHGESFPVGPKILRYYSALR